MHAAFPEFRRTERKDDDIVVMNGGIADSRPAREKKNLLILIHNMKLWESAEALDRRYMG